MPINEKKIGLPLAVFSFFILCISFIFFSSIPMGVYFIIIPFTTIFGFGGISMYIEKDELGSTLVVFGMFLNFLLLAIVAYFKFNWIFIFYLLIGISIICLSMLLLGIYYQNKKRKNKSALTDSKGVSAVESPPLELDRVEER